MSQMTLILIFAFFVVCSIFFVKWNILLGRQKQNYRKLATRYGGNVVNRFIFRPKMWFRYGRSIGYLKSKKKRDSGEHTILTLLWPDSNRLRFLVTTPDIQSRYIRNSYTHGLSAKELGFSRQLNIQTNNVDEFKEMFGQPVRWTLEQLVDQLGTGSISVKLKSGKLTITKRGEVRNFQQLDDLVRLCLELHDKLLLTRTEGLDFVDDHEATVLGEVKCPICSEDVGQEMVICVRCKTPHCKDCWEYNAHCATFACDETRFYEAKSSS